MNDKEAIQYLYEAGETAADAAAERFQAVQVNGRDIYVNRDGRPLAQLNDAIASLTACIADKNRNDTADDIPSLIALVRRYGTAEKTAVFVGSDEVVAVLDMDGWRPHVITLSLASAPAWAFWSVPRAIPAPDAGQEVAPHIDAVANEPTSGDQLLDALSTLAWTSEEKSTARITAEGLTLTSAQSNTVAKLPAAFRVATPVYEFATDTAYALKVRVTARVVGGVRSLVFTPTHAAAQERKARMAVFQEIRDGLADDGIDVYLGTPASFLKP